MKVNILGRFDIVITFWVGNFFWYYVSSHIFGFGNFFLSEIEFQSSRRFVKEPEPKNVVDGVVDKPLLWMFTNEMTLCKKHEWRQSSVNQYPCEEEEKRFEWQVYRTLSLVTIHQWEDTMESLFISMNRNTRSLVWRSKIPFDWNLLKYLVWITMNTRFDYISKESICNWLQFLNGEIV